MAQLAMALELPFYPVIGVLLGGGLGYLIDRWLKTRAVFALILGALGFAAGIAQLIRRASSQGNGDGA